MSDVVVKLLGAQVDWNSVSLDSRIYHSFVSAELEYHRFSVVERSKGDIRRKRLRLEKLQERSKKLSPQLESDSLVAMIWN